jgi:hypothetical protein
MLYECKFLVSVYRIYSVRIGNTLMWVCNVYVGLLISFWLFLFAAQPKEFFLDGLKKSEQRSHS